MAAASSSHSLSYFIFSILPWTRGTASQTSPSVQESVSESLSPWKLSGPSNQRQGRFHGEQRDLLTPATESYLGARWLWVTKFSPVRCYHLISLNSHHIVWKRKLKHSLCANGYKDFPLLGPYLPPLQCPLLGSHFTPLEISLYTVVSKFPP